MEQKCSMPFLCDARGLINFIKMKLFYINGVWEVRRSYFGIEEKEMLHLCPDRLGVWPSVSLCTKGFPNPAGWRVPVHIAFFSHWVQQWRQVLGGFSLHNVANSQENTVCSFLLSSSNHQVLTWLLCLGHKMLWQCLIKSLQNCLVTVLNVRNLCNLNVRYRF